MERDENIKRFFHLQFVILFSTELGKDTETNFD